MHNITDIRTVATTFQPKLWSRVSYQFILWKEVECVPLDSKAELFSPGQLLSEVNLFSMSRFLLVTAIVIKLGGRECVIMFG
jgi:hypothetical protein